MKTKIILLLALSSAITLTAFAQPAPPEPRGRREPPPPQNTGQVDGVVAQYLMNPNGEVDGLLLTDNTQIKFPPHMSADLTRLVKPNDRVTANGERESGQTFHAFTITNAASGQSLVESRPSEFPPRLPPDLRGVNLTPLSAAGKIKALLHAPRGEIDGAVLEDGTILHIRPDAGAQFSSLFAIGQSVSVKGFGTANQFGRSIEVTEIGASGQALRLVYSASTGTPVPLPLPPQ